MSFRQKLYLSYLVVFLVFLILLFPFARNVVDGIVRRTLTIRTQQTIALALTASDIPDMIRVLEAKQPYLFYRVTVVQPDGQIVYDSHPETKAEARKPSDYLKGHPEVTAALRYGSGFGENFSYVLDQPLLYSSRRFEFHGQTLVMSTSYPLAQITEFTEDFQIGFLGLGTIVLLLFSLMTSIIAYHLSRPIQRIIQLIRPYQEGQVDKIPQIKLGGGKRDEFNRLADTLNSLSKRIEIQINTLRYERNEKAAVLDSLIEGVIAVNAEMEVTDANRTALSMLQMEWDELVGHPFINTGQKPFLEMLQMCQDQQEVIAATAELGERKKVYLDVIAAPKEDQSGAVLILQDKSIQYKALEMRKDFIAHASHELKTPITIVRGFAETLHDNPQISPEITADITDKIVRSCDRMERLVKNLLRLADVEHLPKATLAECDLIALIERCKETILALYPDAKITISKPLRDQVTLLADNDLIELLLTNLLENAAKYSKSPRLIDISVNYVAGGEELELKIADNGLGIPAEDIDHIFDRFYTVNKAHSRRLGGSGLGLSLVKTIVTKHFGTISVDSELGKGTTFTIHLPVNFEKYK